jgi:hypothetical protein
VATAFAPLPVPVPMASSVPTSPSLRVYNRIPKGFLAHAETTAETLPLVEPGEVVVVDPYYRDVEEGALFVIEYGRGTNYPSRHIVEPRPHTDAVHTLADDLWWTGAYCRPRSQAEFRDRAARGVGLGGLSDGPAQRIYFNEKLIGRVVGIYRPAAGGVA